MKGVDLLGTTKEDGSGGFLASRCGAVAGTAVPDSPGLPARRIQVRPGFTPHVRGGRLQRSAGDPEFMAPSSHVTPAATRAPQKSLFPRGSALPKKCYSACRGGLINLSSYRKSATYSGARYRVRTLFLQLTINNLRSRTHKEPHKTHFWPSIPIC